MSWIERVLIPPLNKVGQLRHLIAIRDGLAVTLPAVIVGSVFLIISSIPIPAWLKLMKPYQSLFTAANTCTMGVIGLLASAGIAHELAKSYQMDTLSSVGLAVVAYMFTQLNDKFALVTDNFGSGSLFTAIIAAIVSVEIYRYCLKKNWTIKMPDGVPPAVSNSFVSLLPAVMIFVLFWVIRVVLHFDLNAAITKLFSPLVFALNSLPGILIYTFFVSLLWCAGIHGDMTFEGVADPIFLQFVAANAQASLHHQALPYITGSGFSSLFVNVGGTGATLCLVLLMLRAKSKTYRQLGKLAFPASLFEINEPVIFGFPIVMNPIMMIPFVLIPLVLATGSYILMYFNIIGRPMTVVPWTMPPIIGPLLATGWDFRAAIWSFCEIVIAVLMYLPFFKIADRQMLEKEAKEGETENA